MELRKHHFVRADLVLTGGRPHGEKRTTRVSLRRHGVLDPAHGSTLTSRKPGDLGGFRRPAAGGTVGEGVMPCVRLHAAEESDDPIVPEKRTNKTGTPAAEFVEGRGSPEGNASLRPRPR